MQNLYFFCAGLCGLLALLVAGKAGRTTADRLLAGWLLLVGLIFFSLFAEYTKQAWWLVDLGSAAVLLLGPLLWAYARASADKTFRPGKRHGWHLLPFSLHLLLVLPYSFQGQLAPLSVGWRDALAVVKLASLGTYLLLVSQVLKESGSAQIQAAGRQWLRLLWTGLWVAWLLGVLSLTHDKLRPAEPVGDTLLNVFSGLLLLVAGYWGLRKTGLFQNVPSARPEGRYLNSRLDDGQLLDHFEKLTNLMEVHKPYLDPELTLNKLAEKLGFSPHVLSQVINEQSGQNFTDFVNEHRVNEVIRRLDQGDHRHLTLLGLALDAGFNSKTSFNRAFKKKTGLTPTAFLQKRVPAAPK